MGRQSAQECESVHHVDNSEFRVRVGIVRSGRGYQHRVAISTYGVRNAIALWY